jgi:hypothetical protein
MVCSLWFEVYGSLHRGSRIKKENPNIENLEIEPLMSQKTVGFSEMRQQLQTQNHKPQTILAVELYFRNFAAVS